MKTHDWHNFIKVKFIFQKFCVNANLEVSNTNMFLNFQHVLLLVINNDNLPSPIKSRQHLKNQDAIMKWGYYNGFKLCSRGSNHNGYKLFSPLYIAQHVRLPNHYMLPLVIGSHGLCKESRVILCSGRIVCVCTRESESSKQETVYYIQQ